MLNNKTLGYVLLSALLVATLVIAFRPKSIVVDVAEAFYAPMQVTAEQEGKTRVVDHYVVTAPIDAYMQRIEFNEGDAVRKGQTLLVLEPLPSSVLDPRSRAQAEASLGAAEELEKIVKEMGAAALSDQEIANIIFTRTHELRKKKVVSQNELDVAKAEKRRTDAVSRAYQFTGVFAQYLTRMSLSALDYEDIRQNKGENHYFTVSSIVNGKILKQADKSERAVKMGEVLMEIGDLKQIEVEVDVLSTLAVQLQQNMPVEILRWGGARTLQGTIKRIEPSGFTKVSALGIEEQRVNVIVSINTDYHERKQLGDGFRVESRFILWSSDKVLQIPNSALFREGSGKLNKAQDQWAVFVIKGGELETRAVKIGHRNNLMTEVVSGLTAGEQLVAYLANELKDGMQVEAR